MSLENAVRLLERNTGEIIRHACEGLPEDVFLLVSALVPLVNVDLLIEDKQKGVLLAWRDDPYCGRGWHFPGGCLRIRETLAERLQKTALVEVGTEVIYDPKPAAVTEFIAPEQRDGIEHQNIRAHNVGIAYRCTLPEGFEIDNHGRFATTTGYLKWFRELPDDLLKIQDCYRAILK